MTLDKFVISQLLAALCNESAFSAETHKAREDALTFLPHLLDNAEDFELNNLSLDQLLTAYFLCTYCHHPEKHNIKRSINNMLRKNMTQNGILDTPFLLRRKPPTNPRLLVITNSFNSTHVMYRVFAKSLRELKDHFEVINICLHKTDFEAAQCFNRVLQVNLAPIHYLEIVKQIRKLVLDQQPDVIVYADIAMHPFGVFLSNLRLAPLQVVLAGHPAPSMSKFIDYFICENSYSRTNYKGDKMMFFPPDQFAIENPLTGPLNEEKFSGLNIIIPTSLHKITWPFLKTIRTIQRETGAKIHMTSNVAKGNAALADLVNVAVPGIVYYPGLHFDEFIKLVSKMTMFLMPYPFNGFSTILDCFTQAIPGIVMDAPSMESHQGTVMVERASNERGAIVVDTEKNYIAEAIALAGSSSELDFRSGYLADTYGSNLWKGKSLFSSRSPGIANTLKYLLDTGRN